MRALLDTNIIIHREASKVVNQDVGILYRWLDRAKYTKYVHSVTITEIKKYKNHQAVETFQIKLESYEKIEIPSPIQPEVTAVSENIDVNQNDRNDTQLLNEVFVERVDILITEDKKMHKKALELGIDHKVYTIDSFLEKTFAEHPDLVNYKVLNVQKLKFGRINLDDDFFSSLKEDYHGFDKWFIKKFDEEAYITVNSNNGLLLSFLYLKIENKHENYNDILPKFSSKKRLKIGTFKVINNGFRLGERFMKIIFDNALKNKVDEIYVTIFDKREGQRRLIDLFEKWGFVQWGKKGNNELVYVRDFTKKVNPNKLRHTYPYISRKNDCYIVPIYPEYHTELLPDSILNTESPEEFIEDFPHRNSINKVYVSRALLPHPSKGDILIFYMTGGYYKSVISTIGIVQEVKYNFVNEDEFILYCRKSSVFPEEQLRKMWNYSPEKPFVVKFLYNYSFPHRINMKELIDLRVLAGVNDAPRGFKKISKEQLTTILKATKSDESFIVD
ncbi:PIN domain-containing protein [Seonamhaeicola sp.]|uniref:PIN domain-containing protein n=1 Tax=Seonamhaeicola sp. TaxID=1912245 RepID=UPI0026216779|nr:PIN domain-containing protein [Seonamhaeicola sp.]